MENEPTESFVKINIEKLSSAGSGIGYVQQPTGAQIAKVEVPSGLPGDVVSVKLGRKRRGQYLSFIEEIIKPSPFRVAPNCSHVPLCGGCIWQQMDYAEQTRIKQQRLRELFQPFLSANPSLLLPILPCATPWRYRNKMEFSFSQNKEGDRYFGLILRSSRGKVFNLKECYLASLWVADMVQAISKWWSQSKLEAFNLRSNTGSLRTLTVREGVRTGEKMVMLTVSGNPGFALSAGQIQGFVQAARSVVPEEDWPRFSVFLRVHQAIKGQPQPTQFFEMHLAGPDHIKEILYIDTGCGKTSLTFKISPSSFFQPNTMQAEVLYSKALQMVSPSAKNQVLDLYCGTGTLGLAASLMAKEVIGIELNPHAVFDAGSNVEFNQIANYQIFCGDVGRVLEELRMQNKIQSADLVIVDPPRAGLDAKALQHIAQIHSREILYISCNPTTQCRDLLQLQELGYQVAALQPVDQFPHTLHIENIALLHRKK